MKSINYMYEPHILPDVRLPYLYHDNLLISDSKMIANWHRNVEFLRFYSGEGRVVCDGETVFEGAYLSMAFGVGKYSGGGMRQTPDAVLDDGLLDLTIIPDLPLMRIAREAPRLFTGSFLKVPELVVARGRSISVMPLDGSSAEPAEVDGEVIGKIPVRFDVLDSRINIVVGR